MTPQEIKRTPHWDTCQEEKDPRKVQDVEGGSEKLRGKLTLLVLVSFVRYRASKSIIGFIIDLDCVNALLECN